MAKPRIPIPNQAVGNSSRTTIDRHPSSDRVIFAAGLSGHGFKFAPVLGETLAIMALEDRTPAEWEFLSLKRFS